MVAMGLGPLNLKLGNGFVMALGTVVPIVPKFVLGD